MKCMWEREQERERKNNNNNNVVHATHSHSVDSSAARIHFSPFSFHLPFQLYCNLFKPWLSYILRVFLLILSLLSTSMLFGIYRIFLRLSPLLVLVVVILAIRHAHNHERMDPIYNFKLFICLFFVFFSFHFMWVCACIYNWRHVPTWSLLPHALQPQSSKRYLKFNLFTVGCCLVSTVRHKRRTN